MPCEQGKYGRHCQKKTDDCPVPCHSGARRREGGAAKAVPGTEGEVPVERVVTNPDEGRQ
ncbi:hypothetical protein GCM10008101_28410 [Lysobacter xinjiangensis]|uniref:Uncharacterized protein n=1 Tax=Cognatilysobacter xinjiangensis TaxID=546892 RepID=A0ABQ3CBI0_9GAMM|nr:hypothetical protein GCM10008101_28410 [Lysobacter xinjiangensis]